PLPPLSRLLGEVRAPGRVLLGVLRPGALLALLGLGRLLVDGHVAEGAPALLEALVGEGDALEVDALAVFLERGVAHLDEPCAYQAAEDVLEGAAVEPAVAEQLAVEPAGGLAVVAGERGEDALHGLVLAAARLAEAAGDAGVGGA